MPSASAVICGESVRGAFVGAAQGLGRQLHGGVCLLGVGDPAVELLQLGLDAHGVSLRGDLPALAAARRARSEASASSACFEAAADLGGS